MCIMNIVTQSVIKVFSFIFIEMLHYLPINELVHLSLRQYPMRSRSVMTAKCLRVYYGLKPFTIVLN